MAKRQRRQQAMNATSHEQIWAKLKDAPEQQTVVGPLVEHLLGVGWRLEQIVFGRDEWRVPKSPSELTKARERSILQWVPG